MKEIEGVAGEAVASKPGEACLSSGGRLFTEWSILPPVWLSGDRPKSTKRRVFLADAVMEVGRCHFEDWTEADLKAGGSRLEDIANWLLESLRQGSIKGFGLVETGSSFTEIDQAVWLRWDAYPTLFWSCQVPAGWPGHEALLIYLDRASFEQQLGTKLANHPRSGRRQQQIERVAEFFEGVFEDDSLRLRRRDTLFDAARRTFTGARPVEIKEAWRLATEKYPERTRGGRPQKTPLDEKSDRKTDR